MIGYLNDPSLTNKRFIQDPRSSDPQKKLYKTGDIARKDQDGLTYIVGRADDLVKIKGYRINPNEVTNELTKMTTITDAATVVYKEKNHNDAYLVSFVTLSSSITTTEMNHHLTQSLPHYLIPKKIIILSSFPLNNSGKIDKRALKETLSNGAN